LFFSVAVFPITSTFNCVALYCILLHFIALYCIVLFHFISFHFIVLYCTITDDIRSDDIRGQPGQVDMTADVDFSQCARSARRFGARVPALQTQGDFLMRMGIVDRAQRLLDLEETTDEQAEALVSSLKYLVEPEQMGQRFKVLCIAHPKLPTIVGFEDEVGEKNL
jgi:hypothetical protein